MHRSASLPRTVVVGFAFALAGIAACSSSDSETHFPQNTSGTGGGAGSTSGTAGSGGQGGSAPTCDECSQQSCADQTSACTADAACSTWLGCVTACTDTACAQKCSDQNLAAASKAAGVVDCLCKSCSASCTAVDACKVCIDDQALPVMMMPPTSLSETGLYSDIASGTFAAKAKAFHPRYPLWSDGATKDRHVYIPKCAQIDTTDMDHWDLPVGSRFWKEFTVDGTRVETRLIHRFGPGNSDWFFAAYQWSMDLSDATFVPDFVPNANGTTHDIPAQADCTKCHKTLPERILGFSAFQLSHSEDGETIASLSAAGKLTVPKPDGFQVPGDATAQAALGYLHANCGNCHNDKGITFITMHLRLLTSNTTVQSTDAYQTAVGVPVDNFSCPVMPCMRIAPGDAADSAVIIRMSSRGTSAQMPPLATKVVDDMGVQAVTDWINAL